MATVWRKDHFVALAEDYKGLLVFIRENPYVLKVIGNHVMPSTYPKFFKLINKAAHDDFTKIWLMGPLIEGEFEYAETDFSRFMRERSRLPNRVTGDFILSIGSGYLRALLGDLIREVMNNRMVSFEVDPEKARKGLDVNRRNLLLTARKFLERIISREMLDKIPRPIRALCAIVAEKARAYGLADKVHPLIGNLVMLRFITPSVAIPEFYGTSPDGRVPTGRTRRNLVLVSKLLQCLSNGVRPGDSEDYLRPLDAFFDENIGRFRAYLEDVIADPYADAGETPWDDFRDSFRAMAPADFEIEGNFKLRELAIAHRVLAVNRGLILEKVGPMSHGALGADDVRRLADRLDALLRTLKEPVTIAPEPYVDLDNPRVKEYTAVKVNKRGRRQQRVIKFAATSIINIDRREPGNMDSPASIQNEILVGEIAEIVRDPEAPTLSLVFDKGARVAPSHVGYFPPRAAPKSRKPRVYEFESARTRDEVFGEVLEICFSRHAAFDPLAFELTKVNKYGKAQRRVFKLSRDSLMNLRGRRIRSETHFSEIEFVREDRVDPCVMWLKMKKEDVTRQNICKSMAERKALQTLLQEGIEKFEA